MSEHAILWVLLKESYLPSSNILKFSVPHHAMNEDGDIPSATISHQPPFRPSRLPRQSLAAGGSDTAPAGAVSPLPRAPGAATRATRPARRRGSVRRVGRRWRAVRRAARWGARL